MSFYFKDSESLEGGKEIIESTVPEDVNSKTTRIKIMEGFGCVVCDRAGDRDKIRSWIRKLPAKKLKVVYFSSFNNTSDSGTIRVYIPKSKFLGLRQYMEKTEKRGGIIEFEEQEKDGQFLEEDVRLYDTDSHDKDHLEELDSIYGGRPLILYMRNYLR